MSLKVFCPSCGVVLERGILDDHWNKCPTECKFGCGLRLPPKDFATHKQICKERPVFCPAKVMTHLLNSDPYCRCMDVLGMIKWICWMFTRPNANMLLLHHGLKKICD